MLIQPGQVGVLPAGIIHLRHLRRKQHQPHPILPGRGRRQAGRLADAQHRLGRLAQRVGGAARRVGQERLGQRRVIVVGRQVGQFAAVHHHPFVHLRRQVRHRSGKGRPREKLILVMVQQRGQHHRQGRQQRRPLHRPGQAAQHQHPGQQQVIHQRRRQQRPYHVHRPGLRDEKGEQHRGQRQKQQQPLGPRKGRLPPGRGTPRRAPTHPQQHRQQHRQQQRRRQQPAGQRLVVIGKVENEQRLDEFGQPRPGNPIRPTTNLAQLAWQHQQPRSKKQQHKQVGQNNRPGVLPAGRAPPPAPPMPHQPQIQPGNEHHRQVVGIQRQRAKQRKASPGPALARLPAAHKAVDHRHRGKAQQGVHARLLAIINGKGGDGRDERRRPPGPPVVQAAGQQVDHGHRQAAEQYGEGARPGRGASPHRHPAMQPGVIQQRMLLRRRAAAAHSAGQHRRRRVLRKQNAERFVIPHRPAVQIHQPQQHRQQQYSQQRPMLAKDARRHLPTPAPQSGRWSRHSPGKQCRPAAQPGRG